MSISGLEIFTVFVYVGLSFYLWFEKMFSDDKDQNNLNQWIK